VLPYLIRLADRYDITLISFEKGGDDVASLGEDLNRQGITWVPLRYHRRPPVLSTILDVLQARRALIRAARSGGPAILHVRSYVPALMALIARRRTGGRLLFDIRGFWADERVEGGLWRRGGLLYRVAKRYERQFFARADAIVTLTAASVPQIRSWTGQREVPIEVIPTCVDLERFGDRPPRPEGPHAMWVGSIGTWYRFDLAAPLAAALSMPLTVITRQVDLARATLGDYPAELRSATPDGVPAELFAGDAGLCLIASSFSKTASAPTRFAEHLAAGMPVMVTPGVGDLESIVEENGVGVVLRGEDEDSIRQAALRMRELAVDSEAQARCRRVARELFDVNSGAARYAELYERLTR
jgi:glycosyltransferase involved in cell wall biosynthesis